MARTPHPLLATTVPDVAVTADDPTTLEVDALLVGVFRGAIEAPGTDAVLRALGIADVPREDGFRGKVGEVLHLAAPGLLVGQVTLVGLGRLDELSAETVRRAAGAAVRAVAPRCTTIATTLPLADPTLETIRAAAEGALLGAYRYDAARSDRDPVALRTVTLVVPTGRLAAAEGEVDRARVHARAQYVARDLVSCPPDRLGPPEFADVAVRIVPDTVTVEVWDEIRLAEEGCGGLLAVGAGSHRPPRLVRLRYRPSDPIAHVALECAAIAVGRLGGRIDVQGGGSDLLFPHHEHSALEAEALTGQAPFATAYVHAGMVGLDGEKMSKSLGNLVFVHRLHAAGVEAGAVRLALLASHYRDDREWTDEVLRTGQDRLAAWRSAVRRPAAGSGTALLARLRAALADDLDTPSALAAVDDWCRQDGADDGAPGLVRDAVDALLGVDLS